MSPGRADRLVLASRSPRRHEALVALGLTFETFVSEVEQRLGVLDDPTDPVPIAAAKALDGAARFPDAVVLGGDTIVVLPEPQRGGLALGKPADAAEARMMLRRLRGGGHVVRTGLAVCGGAEQITAEVPCPVVMRAYADGDLESYVQTGEPLDCAGAYDVHREGGGLVAAVTGCFSAVVGLPLVAAAALLEGAGLAPAREPVATCSRLYGRPCLAGVAETAARCAPQRLTRMPLGPRPET